MRRRVKGTAFVVRNGRRAKRARADGTIQEDILAVIVQRKPVFVDGAFAFMFYGGCTLVIDPGTPPHSEPRIRYAVSKRVASAGRLEREIAFRMGGEAAGARALYFDDEWNGAEPFAALHAVPEEDD